MQTRTKSNFRKLKPHTLNQITFNENVKCHFMFLTCEVFNSIQSFYLGLIVHTLSFTTNATLQESSSSWPNSTIYYDKGIFAHKLQSFHPSIQVIFSFSLTTF